MDQPNDGFQISDRTLDMEINVRYGNNLPVCHSISSLDCALEMAYSISRRGTAF